MTAEYSTLWLIPAMPLFGAILAGAMALWLPKQLPKAIAAWVACLASFGAFAVTCTAFVRLKVDMGDGEGGIEALTCSLWTWLDTDALTVGMDLWYDPLSSVLALVVTGVGFLIHVYSIGYMQGDRSVPRYFAYLNLFLFNMLVLVLGRSLPVMFLGWEGVGLCSYLLIGFWFEDPSKAAA